MFFRLKNNPSMPQYSTALSDGVLVIFSLFTAFYIYSTSIIACIGFLMMASAATLGTIRFSSTSPSDSLIDWHKYLSQLTASLGLPLISVAYLRLWQPYVAHIVLIASIILFLIQSQLKRSIALGAGNAISAVAMLTVLLQSFVNFNLYGIIGVALFAIAALIVKTEGNIFFLLRVDVFHYMLAVANIALLKGLLVISDLPDYYYRHV